MPLGWERFAEAGADIYVDLPILTHYWGLTTRFVAGLFKNPEGWPHNSPIWGNTWDSYRIVALPSPFASQVPPARLASWHH